MSDVPQVSIIIATHGDQGWADLAFQHAFPSADRNARREMNLDEVIVRHSPESTLSEARNIAAAFATKDWLCFLDADDQLSDGYIEAMTEPMWAASHYYQPPLLIGEEGIWQESMPMQLLAPAVSYLSESKSKVAANLTPAAIPNAGRWPDLNTAVIGTLIPRLMFHAVGGFRELPIYEDWDLWLRCVKRGAEIRYVEDAIYYATESPTGRNKKTDGNIWYQRIRSDHAELFQDRV